MTSKKKLNVFLLKKGEGKIPHTFFLSVMESSSSDEYSSDDHLCCDDPNCTNVCREDQMSKCFNCGDVYCVECEINIEVCSKCKNRFCAECFLDKEVCEHCEKTECPSCLKEKIFDCEQCGVTCCKTCAGFCDGCGGSYCIDCVSEGLPYKNGTKLNCETCLREFGVACVDCKMLVKNPRRAKMCELCSDLRCVKCHRATRDSMCRHCSVINRESRQITEYFTGAFGGISKKN